MEHHSLSLLAGVESITRGVTAEGHEGGHIRTVIILKMGGHPDIVWDKPVRVRGKSGPISFPENASEALFILKIFGLIQCLCLMDSPYILSFGFIFLTLLMCPCSILTTRKLFLPSLQLARHSNCMSSKMKNVGNLIFNPN